MTSIKINGRAQKALAAYGSDEVEDVAHGMTFAVWLEMAGRTDTTSEYVLRAAWRAGEDPAEYAE